MSETIFDILKDNDVKIIIWCYLLDLHIWYKDKTHLRIHLSCTWPDFT